MVNRATYKAVSQTTSQRLGRAMLLATAAISIGMLPIAAAPALADVQAGVRKYEEGDYKAAIQEWLPLAGENEPNALFNLGQVFRLGRGVDKDMATARNYYERASQLGHVSAQGNLATLYYFADTEALRDRDKAISWWQEAASNGDARSQYMLGVLYFNGDVVERDWRKAYAWMSLATASGLPEAGDAETSMLKHLTAAQVADAKEISLTLVNPAGAFPNSMPVQFTKPAAASAPAKAYPAAATQAIVPVEKVVPASAPDTGSDIGADSALQMADAADAMGESMGSPGFPSDEFTDPGDGLARALRDNPEQDLLGEIPKDFEAEFESPVNPTQMADASAAMVPPGSDMPQTSAGMAAADPMVEQPAMDYGAAFAPWRLQLAAFSSPASADNGWNIISGKHDSVLGSLKADVIEAQIGERTLYRLFADGFATKANAVDACLQLKSEGQGCMVVKTPS